MMQQGPKVLHSVSGTDLPTICPDQPTVLHSPSPVNSLSLNRRAWLNEAIKSSELRENLKPISRQHAYRLVHESTKLQDQELCRRVQALLVYSCLDSVPLLANHLIRLFTNCANLVEANQAFSKIATPDQYTWNAVFDAHTKAGKGETSLQLYHRLQQDGRKSDKVTFLSILKACSGLGSIEQTRHIHQESIDGLLYDIVVSNTLIDTYVKCGKLQEAEGIFNKLCNRDVISWNAIIAGYAQNGELQLALECFEGMKEEGIPPDKFTYSSMLKACGSMGAIVDVRQIHELIIKSGVQFDIVMGNILIDVYAKCKSLDEAQRVFERLPGWDVVSWNAILTGYTQQNEVHVAIENYLEMQNMGIKPSKITFLVILKACSSICIIELARCIHAKIIGSRHQFDIQIGSSLIDLYAKCGDLEEAFMVFDGIKSRDVVAWDAMIAGLAQHGESKLVMDLFRDMQHEDISPSKITFLSIFKVCSNEKSVELGRCIHELVIEDGFQSDIIVGSTIIDMYAKCGCLHEAHNMFNILPNRNVITWSVLIAGYAQYGESNLALKCYEHMQQECLMLDKVIFLSALKACGGIFSLEKARFIHEHIMENGLQCDVVVSNALIDTYAKCRSFDEAFRVFDGLQVQDLVSWNTMITGYVQHGECCLALECFKSLQNEGMQADKITFSSILKACGTVGAIDHGRQIHKEIVERGLLSENIVCNTLVDMYTKCGSLEDACRVFDGLVNRDVVSWTAMIEGHAQLGKVGLAIHCFNTMCDSGIRPDDVAFVSVLTAFGRVGLVDEGLWHYRNMKEYPYVRLNIFHIACLVDLLGRAGYFSGIEDILRGNMVSSIRLWLNLLSSCRMHGNVEVGRRCFDAVMQLNPGSSTAYVLMSNIYANAGG